MQTREREIARIRVECEIAPFGVELGAPPHALGEPSLGSAKKDPAQEQAAPSHAVGA